MKTVIFYFTGTGNSLWTARTVAAGLGSTELHSMTLMNADAASGADAIGFVFPVHMWGIPGLVLDFLKKFKKDPGKYYFAFAVNAGQVSRTLIQLKNILSKNGIKLSAGFDVVLPSNYIPWGGPGPAERLEKLHNAAKEKIKNAVNVIARKQFYPMDKGKLWHRIVFTALYKMTFNMVHKMDRDFRIDEKCNECGICGKVCPVGNIVMVSGRPEWQHRCEQCFACLQWCPKEAIQYGKKTPAYERYHHPEVKVKDLIF